MISIIRRIEAAYENDVLNDEEKGVLYTSHKALQNVMRINSSTNPIRVIYDGFHGDNSHPAKNQVQMALSELHGRIAGSFGENVQQILEKVEVDATVSASAASGRVYGLRKRPE